MATLLDLPNHILLLIINNLPLTFVNSFDQIHDRFSNELKQQAFLQRKKLSFHLLGHSSNKSSIEFLDSNYVRLPRVEQDETYGVFDPEANQHDSLNLNGNITSERIEKLSQNLRGIKTLEIYHHSIDPSIRIIDLLTLWSKSLENLTLWFVAPFPQQAQNINPHQLRFISDLFHKLTELPKLRNLTLEGINFSLDFLPNIYLPILLQLNNFTIDSPDNAIRLLISLKYYAIDNHRLQSIAMNNTIDGLTNIRSFYNQLPKELARKFIYLNIEQCNTDCEEMHKFFTKFNSLTTLSFKPAIHQSIFDLSKILSPLTQLTYLRLQILHFRPLKELNFRIISKLTTIKVLVIKISDCALMKCNNLTSLRFEFLFPNLEILRLKHCCIRVHDFIHNFVKQFEKYCPRLKRIYTQIN